jgi:hypothetical protein
LPLKPPVYSSFIHTLMSLLVKNTCFCEHLRRDGFNQWKSLALPPRPARIIATCTTCRCTLSAPHHYASLHMSVLRSLMNARPYVPRRLHHDVDYVVDVYRYRYSNPSLTAQQTVVKRNCTCSCNTRTYGTTSRALGSRVASVLDNRIVHISGMGAGRGGECLSVSLRYVMYRPITY